MPNEKFNYYKEFKKMNKLLDLDYNQLYDKYHDLKLSHKRLEKLLKRTLDYLDSLGFIESDNGDYYSLYEAIDAELKNPLYRVRERKK